MTIATAALATATASDRSGAQAAGGVGPLPGLPVLAAEADAALSSSSSRLLTLLAGLVAVGLVLLAMFRDPGRALVPLVPIALATGWAALILRSTGSAVLASGITAIAGLGC